MAGREHWLIEPLQVGAAAAGPSIQTRHPVGAQPLSLSAVQSAPPIALRQLQRRRSAVRCCCGRTDAEASSSVGPATFGFAFPKMRCMTAMCETSGVLSALICSAVLCCADEWKWSDWVVCGWLATDDGEWPGHDTSQCHPHPLRCTHSPINSSSSSSPLSPSPPSLPPPAVASEIFPRAAAKRLSGPGDDRYGAVIRPSASSSSSSSAARGIRKQRTRVRVCPKLVGRRQQAAVSSARSGG